MSTQMKFGNYSFSPVPIISDIRKEIVRTDSGEKIGTKFTLSLDGTLTPLPDNNGGLSNLAPLKQALEDELSIEGRHFWVACNGTVILSCYPNITNINFTETNNNWVYTIDYTIEMEFMDEPAGNGEDIDYMPPYIDSANEDWSIEFANNDYYTQTLNGPITDELPYVLRLTHNLSAEGRQHWTGGSGTGDITGSLDRQAWQEAREWVVERVGLNTSVIGEYSTGVFNFDISDFGYFDHIRQNTINESAGTYSVTESWMILPTGNIPANATEDFTVDISKSIDNSINRVSIRGNIQGLESRNYGSNSGDFEITETKYDAATAYWATASGRLYERANVITSGQLLRSLNINPLSTSISHSVKAGQISYSYEYDDRPCTLVSGALSETISINDTMPTDVFASLTVPGRARGPILQSMNTVTVYNRSVSIDVVVNPTTGCGTGIMSSIIAAKPTGEINTILCEIQTDLENNYNQVFKSQDTDSWNPRTGRYNRNVQWTYTSCSGDAPSTNFC